MDFSPEQRRRALEQVDVALDCEEVETYRNHGYNPRIIDLQCQLNAAVELLRSCHSPASWHAEQVNAFLADFPEVEGGHE